MPAKELVSLVLAEADLIFSNDPPPEAIELIREHHERIFGRPPPDQGDHWIKPPEAAAIANVPTKRIYTWAKGKAWASHPTRRCLRISEQRFRRWLLTR